jgi:hypothetical protein
MRFCEGGSIDVSTILNRAVLALANTDYYFGILSRANEIWRHDRQQSIVRSLASSFIVVYLLNWAMTSLANTYDVVKARFLIAGSDSLKHYLED